MEVSGQLHVSAALIPGGKPQYTLNERLGEFLSWLRKF